MSSYKLVTYQSEKGPRAGVVVDDKLFDAAALTRKAAYASMLDILNDWSSAKGTLKKAAAAAGKSKLKSRPVGKAKLLAPVMWPSAIYCAGANYTDHMMEMAKLQGIPPAPDPHDVGLKPWHFIKASRTVVGDKATIKLPEGLQGDRLGGRARRRDRQEGQGRAAGEGARLRCRLHGRQRAVGARPRPPRPAAGRDAVQVGLGRPEVLRRRLPDRPVDRSGERHQGPAEARHQALGQ